MESVELKISNRDWLHISMIGTLFGFFVSVFFYFLHEVFRDMSTILFGTSSAFCITLFSSIFITVSNKYILPSLSEKLWYIISFLFSFLSGALGFLFTYFIFYIIETKISNIIEPYSLYLALTIGALTFFIGLIFHQFITIKYKNESIKNDILRSQIHSLENELNPHFLFNALNSMSELVYIDPKKAEDSILNLSKFLRNAIKINSLISINNELEMVQTYVDIENIRFDDKIKLHIVNENIIIVKYQNFLFNYSLKMRLNMGMKIKN